MKTVLLEKSNPTFHQERSIILDTLRGVALFGICLANFSEFSLYTFLKNDTALAMPTSCMDRIIQYGQYIFIDGKFYTMFSVLFGLGYSIILSNAMRKNSNGFRIFTRRMGILFIIGFLHLMFIWSGDILMLYALLGLFLPLFRNVANKNLLVTSASLLLLPIVVDVVREAFGINPSVAVVRMQQYFCAKYGITEDNFAFWLRDADSYGSVFKFLVQGAFVRIQEFIDGNRIFKVMGLFLLGFYIGRTRLYANLDRHQFLLKRVSLFGFIVGVPVSVLYAWSALNEHSWGQAVHSALYAFGVFPMGLAYMASICLWFLNHRESLAIKILAAPGKMALTNYIGQSLLGIIIFYGIGFGFGANTGLAYVVLIAGGVYLLEIIFSHIWLSYCLFGPLEWIWRMLTYNKRLSLFK